MNFGAKTVWPARLEPLGPVPIYAEQTCDWPLVVSEPHHQSTASLIYTAGASVPCFVACTADCIPTTATANPHNQKAKQGVADPATN